MSTEGAGVSVEVHYAKLVKWPNHPDGTPDKSGQPLEVREKFGDDSPFAVTFQRSQDNASA